LYTSEAGDAIRKGEHFYLFRNGRQRNGDADLSAIDHVARQIATEADLRSW